MEHFAKKMLLMLLCVLATATTSVTMAQGEALIDESFDSWSSATTIPTGWSTVVTKGTASTSYYWKFNSSATVGHNSTRCAYGYFTSTYKQGLLLSPTVTLSTDQILRFWLKMTYIDHGQLVVAFADSTKQDNDPQTIEVSDTLGIYFTDQTAIWQEMEISLKTLTGKTGRLVFGVTEYSGTTYLYLDDVLVEDYPGCQPATDFVIDALGQDSAKISWNYGTGNVMPNFNSISVEEKVSGRVVYTNPNVPSTTQSISVSGLTANTKYILRVTGDCRQGSQQGVTKPISYEFKTLMAPIALPYFENFDSSEELPAGWYNSFDYPDGTEINTATTASYLHTPPHSLKLATLANGGKAAGVFTPQINEAANNIQLDFWAKPGTATATAPRKLLVYLCKSPVDYETAVLLLDTTFTGTTYQNFRLTTDNSGSYGSQTGCCFKFHVDASSAANTFYIDDVTISRKPNCIRPEGLTADSIGDSGLKLTWEDITPAPAYAVKIENGTTVRIDTVTSNPCTISNLTPSYADASSDYTFSVKALCSATDTSEWSLPVSVTMMCAPDANPIFTEEFDNINGTGAKPDCWNFVDEGGTGTLTLSNSTTSTYLYGTTGRYISIYCSSGATKRGLLVSKPITVDQAGKYDVHFQLYRHASTSSYTAVTNVWVNNRPDTVGGQKLLSIPNKCDLAPVEAAAGKYMYWANIPISGTVYIMIEHSGYGYTYLDHLYTEQRPACRPVEDIHVDQSKCTTTSATIAWTGHDEDSWIVRTSLTSGGVTTRDTATVTQPEYTITGLSIGEVYDAVIEVIAANSVQGTQGEAVIYNGHIRTACSDNGIVTLPWTEDFETFTTEELGDGCFDLIVNGFGTASTPYGMASINTSTSYLPAGSTRNLKIGNCSTSVQYLVLPEFANQQNGVKITFTYRHYSTSATYHSELWYGYMTGMDTSTFVTLGTRAITTASTIYTNTLNSIPTGCHLAFKYGGNYNGNSYAIYLDDIIVIEKPACEMINFPVASVINPFSATLASATKVDSDCYWEVAYGVEDTPVESCTVVRSAIGDSLITVTGLQQFTDYDFYGRRICADGSASPWSIKRTFKTRCAPFVVTEQTPFIETFDEWATTRDDQCYTQENTTSSYYWRGSTSSSYIYQGTKCGYGYGNAANGIPGIYRLMHLEGGKKYEMAIESYGYSASYTNQLALVYGETPDRTQMTEVGVIRSAYKEKNYEKHYFIPAVTGDYYVGFYGKIPDDNTGTATTFSYYVDTFSVREMSCIPPQEMTIDSISINCARFAFTSDAAEWEIQYTDGVNDSVSTVFSQNPFVLTGLASGTHYEYRFRSHCNEGKVSDWSKTDGFNTYCEPKAIPYNDGFENDAALICWSTLGDGNVSRAANVRHSGTSSMLVQNVTAISPELDVTSLAQYGMSAFAYSDEDSAQFIIGAIGDLTDPVGSFEQTATVTLPTANKWQEISSYFDAVAEGEYPNSRNIAFVTIGDKKVYIDDLTVEPAASCRRPTDLEITEVTDTSITLSWTENNAETAWVVTTNGEEHHVTTNPVTITGLVAKTVYDVRIAALCASGDTSNFSSFGTIETLCPFIAETPWFEDFESFPNQASLASGCIEYYPYNISGTSTYPYATIDAATTNRSDLYGKYTLKLAPSKTDSMFIVLPVMDVEVSHLTMDFHYLSYSSTSCADLSVGLMTDPSDKSTYRNLQTFPKAPYSTSKNEPQTHFSFAGKVPAGYEHAHIVFMNGTYTTASVTYFTEIDNIMVKELKSCTDPSVPSVGKIMSTSAEVTFTDTAATHTNWQYVVCAPGEKVKDKTPIDITNDTIQLTGLTPNTDYTVAVRAYCSATEQSNWMSTQFHTPAAPTAMPFITGFEDAEENQGWFLESGESANFFVTASDEAAVKDGSMALYVSNDGTSYSHNTGVYSTSYAYRVFEFEDLKYEINFDWQASGGYGTTSYGRAFLVPSTWEAIQSTTSTAPTGLSATALPAGAIALDGETKMNLKEGWNHQNNIIDMTGKAGSYKLVFYWRGANSTSNLQAPLSIDNLTVREITCMYPSNLSVDNVTDTSATVKFHNDAPGSTIEYAISTLNDIEAAFATGVQTTDSTIEISHLSPSLTYYVFLRSRCSDTDQSPWVSTVFGTDCGTITMLPLYESFENCGTSIPSCWSQATLVPESAASTNYWKCTKAAATSTYKTDGLCYLSMDKSATRALLQLPKTHFSADKDYYFSFYWYTFVATSAINNALNVYVSSDSLDIENADRIFAEVENNGRVSSSGMCKYTVDIPNIDGDYYIILEGITNYTTSQYMYFDELMIGQYPDCRPMENKPSVVAVGDNYAMLEMEDFHTGWQYAWSTAGIETAAGTLTTDETSVYISGLQNNTTYNLFVRGFCRNNDTTAWIPAATFTTKENACYAPERIRIISAQSDTLADIAWYHGSGITQFNYEVYSSDTSFSGVVTSDTLRLRHINFGTYYTVKIGVACGDSVNWDSIRFRTDVLPTNIPYSTGFEAEDDNDKWTIANANKNKLIIGTNAAAVRSGSQALYVTDDPGTGAYQYTISTAGSSFAYRPVNMEPGLYTVSYDWKLYGESTYDYCRVLLLPAGESIAATNSTTVGIKGLSATSIPANAISLDGNTKLNLQTTWQKFNGDFEFDKTGVYNIVVAWRNDGSGGTTPPLAFDNFSLERVECPYVKDIAIAAVDTFANISFKVYDNSKPVQFGYSKVNNVDSVDTLYTLTNIQKMRVDTIVRDLEMNTQYYLFARIVCEDSTFSDWSQKPFKTYIHPAELPYVCGFEAGQDSLWVFKQGSQKAKWIIGTGASHGGERAMYISNKGSDNVYEGATASVSYATRIFYFEPGEYEISFDWKANGESTLDFVRAFFAPVDFTLTPGSMPVGTSATGASSTMSYSVTPVELLPLDGGTKLNLSNVWNESYTTGMLNEPTTCQLVFLWKNDASVYNEAPGAIDNIVVRQLTCPAPKSVKATGTGFTTGTIVINEGRDTVATTYVVAYGTKSSRNEATFDTIYNTDTLQLTGLKASSRYNVWVETLCEDGSDSRWLHTTFDTECQTAELPYFQDFEGSTVFPPVCWSKQAITPATGTTNFGDWSIYSTTATSTYRHSGTQCMTMNASGVGARTIISLPAVNFEAGHDYDYQFSMYRGSTSYKNKVRVWVGPNANSLTGATLLDVYNVNYDSLPVEGTTGNYTYRAPIPASITGLNYVIFEGDQQYSSTSYTYVYIDDVRVAEKVQGDTYTDTLCGYVDYVGYGFNLAARDIQSGFNTFTRRIEKEDGPDSIITLNIYRFAPAYSIINDTICRGEVYNVPPFLNKTDAGTYQEILPASTGCDSTIYLNLYVKDIEYHYYDTICQGDSAMFENQWYKTQGTYPSDSLNSRGCTETSFFHLTVEQTWFEEYDTICEGESREFHGLICTRNQIYDYHDTTAFGCARTYRLHLKVDASNPVFYDTICSGQTRMFGSQALNSTGTYTRSYSTAKGCPVNETLHLTVNDPIIVTHYDDACEGYPYYNYGIMGATITHDTIIEVPGKRADFCDTIAYVHITFHATDSSDIYKTINRGDIYNWDGTDLTEPGDYPAVFRSIYNCDSVVTLHLTVLPDDGSGIENVTSVKIDVVPNPVTAGMTAYVHGDFGEVENVEILNNFGQVIDRFVPSTYPIEIRGIEASGLYFVRINTADGNVYTEKLIVK